LLYAAGNPGWTRIRHIALTLLQKEKLSHTPLGWRIMRPMTRAHLRANWIGPPSLTELWLGALLRMVAMLVHYAASFFRMRLSRLPRECHVDVTPETLPEPESGILMETKEAAASSQTAARPQPAYASFSAAACGGDGCGGDGCGGDGCGGGCGDNARIFPASGEFRTATGTRTGLRMDDDDSAWNFLASPDSRMRTDTTHI
jgi:hypothetical protein